MNPSAWKKRLLIPRWRSFASTLRSHELEASSPKRRKHADGELAVELVSALEKWRLTPNLFSAAELMESAIVAGCEAETLNAARRLVFVERNAAPLIRQQAAALLVRNGYKGALPEDVQLGPVTLENRWRRQIRAYGRDSLTWVELALEQTIRGHSQQAMRSMAVALQLAPDNRHVLRSAARLFLHRGDKERAHDVIVRSPATRTDPWLLAAEIALSSVADRSPRFFKQGMRVLDEGGLRPRQITELAGSVATRELLDGNRKRSKKIFIQSMIDPTGNSLAQGEWATPYLGGEVVPPTSFSRVQETEEAAALHLYRELRLSEVPEACERWAGAVPYSTRPFEFGSTAAAIVDAFESAASLAARGLRLDPRSAVLRNTQAFALASMDRAAEAERLLAGIPATNPNDLTSFVTMANKGLIAFRLNRIEEGTRYYLEAIEGLRRMGWLNLSAHARVYFAKEALRADLPGASKLASEAKEAIDKVKEREAVFSRIRIDKAIKAAQSRPQK